MLYAEKFYHIFNNLTTLSNADTSNNGAIFPGEHIPASSLRGHFEIYYEPLPVAAAVGSFLSGFKTGHFVRMSNLGLETSPPDNLPPGQIAWNTPGNGAFDPRQLAQIDRKVDDGMPLTGNIYALPQRTTANSDGLECAVGIIPGAAYNETTDEKKCTLAMFLIE